MHRIDSTGATSDNHFTDGDPAIPIASTVVNADWLNAVQPFRSLKSWVRNYG